MMVAHCVLCDGGSEFYHVMLTFLKWTKPGDLQSNFFLEIGDYLADKHFQAVFM
jgi:hypothetical protein